MKTYRQYFLTLLLMFLFQPAILWAAGEQDHANLKFENYPDNCLNCHAEEAGEVHKSTHYQWLGQAPDMTNGTHVLQGKLTNAVNSYCINIKGDWPVCGSCHAGRGKRPDDPTAGLENIDCLVCHNEQYAKERKRLADGSMGVTTPTDSMVQNIQEPSRTNCLMCHAKAGGGDGVKRGDLSLALIDNTDEHFDVHMNTNDHDSDLACQECHTFKNHRVIGKGSDLRPTDDPTRGAELACTNCHSNEEIGKEHQSELKPHLARVACQTCHIPFYAKVPTEIHREWLTHHDGSDATACTEQAPCPDHPYTVKASNLIPEYKWWNRKSDNYLLFDDASRTFDEAKQTYPTSRPLGNVNDGKLYPFKYKTANQPMTIADNRLIALDTLEYLKKSGNVNLSVEKGLLNMGYAANEPYSWVTTDTYQLLNHGVEDSDTALRCNDCHGSSNRMNLKEKLGYQLKGEQTAVCNQCHEKEKIEPKDFKSMHKKHVSDKSNDCSWCHDFSRPERGLKMPEI